MQLTQQKVKEVTRIVAPYMGLAFVLGSLTAGALLLYKKRNKRR